MAFRSDRGYTSIPACFIEFNGGINISKGIVGGGAVLTYPNNMTDQIKIKLKINELNVCDNIKYAIAAMRALLHAIDKAREKGHRVLRATTSLATKLEIDSWRQNQSVPLIRQLFEEFDRYLLGCSFIMYSTTEFNRPMEVVTGLVNEALEI